MAESLTQKIARQGFVEDLQERAQSFRNMRLLAGANSLPDVAEAYVELAEKIEAAAREVDRS